ncbi:beta-agarase [Bacteroidota bacterium]
MKKSMLLIVITSILPVFLAAQTGIPNNELAKGYIYVKQIDNVWWFIGPDGERFVSQGVNHIEPHLYLAPYNKEETMKKYGDELIDGKGLFDTNTEAAQKFIDGQIAICKDLHFNTFAKHTHASIAPELYMDKTYYIASFETAPVATWQIKAGQGPMPDVFSSDFENHVEKRVKEVVLKHKDSPNLIGYLYCDVPAWILPSYMQKSENEYLMVYPWVDAMMSLGVGSPGKKAWIDHLKERYTSAAEAADMWGLYYIKLYGLEWEELYKMTDWTNPLDSVKATADMRSFMGKIAERWYKMHYDAIKKHDQNHLIIGDKSDVSTYQDFLLPALKKYIDVIAIQSYNVWTNDKATADWLYKELGKPMFNGDGSFAYVHPNQSENKVKGWWTGAKNIQDVISMYKEQMEMMMAEPYVIGWHHCGMLQQWDGSARGDVPSNENGFMDPFENYYTEWTDVIKEMNSNAVEMHQEAKQVKWNP